MEFKQKKNSTTHTFTFNNEYLNFAYKEKSGEGDFDINYANILINALFKLNKMNG